MALLRKRNGIKMIEEGSFLIGVLLFSFALTSSRGFSERQDHEPGDRKNEGRKVVAKNPENAGDSCKIDRGDISNFANGEGYNFNSIVQLVANPECARFSNAIVATEIGMGVKFNHSPFHLDELSKGYSNLTIDGKRNVEAGIEKNVAATLRSNPLSNRELLPVLGQLALLSPKSARSMLSYLITQELVSQEMEGKKGLRDDRDLSLAVDTISTLKKFGADQPLIVNELARNVEDMATTAQADSLGKVLTGLALAAIEFEEFSPAFNSSAGAFKKGVGQAIDDYTDEERGRLLKASFAAANAAIKYSPGIESGVRDVNGAIELLLRGQSLDQTTLKSVWRKVLEVTASSEEQKALAEALALSFTSNVIYLPKGDRDRVIACAKLHPAVADVIQEMFLEAWNESRTQLANRKLKVVQFNERKEKFFEPWIAGILEIEATSINPNWMREVVARGMVKDDAVQTKFPKFVLSLLTVHENSAKKAILEGGVEPMMESAMTGFNVLRNLSSTYIPALNDWAKRHDEE